MKSFVYFPTVATVMACAATAIAAPTGHLGYLKGARAIVSSAATGRETILPGQAPVGILSVSPRGEALYFSIRAGQKLGPDDTPVSDGMLARAPYKTAQKLASLSSVKIYNAHWDRSGSSFYLSGDNVSGVYSPTSRRSQHLSPLPYDQSSDGRTLAYADDATIRVKNATTGRERVIFSIKKPKPVFDALAKAKYPRGVKDLKDGVDPELWKDANNWRMSAVALEPSGKRLYFACNMGEAAGAAGNTTWAIFGCDLATGKIAVLSKVGAFFSRPPDIFEVSPDAKRLLIVSSSHSSAIDNASSLFVVDLQTQNSRELLLKQAPKNTDTNLSSGACWSPDSKYIAFSALYYSAEALMKRPDSDWEPDPKYWRLFVADAATGKVLRTVPGATMPSWGR